MKIIIVGGGKVGFYLAQTLSAQGHEAAIIEQDRELCRMIANQLDISICTGDGTSQDVLREAGAERADVVCAVTGKDESNLVCCQTAKKVFDVKKTVAKVNNPNNVAALRTLGVDTVVSSTDNIIEHLEREVDISAMKELIPLDGGDASLQEITLPDDSELAGKSLMELSMPQTCNVVCISRGGHTLIPRGQTRLHGGDVLLVDSQAWRARPAQGSQDKGLIKAAPRVFAALPRQGHNDGRKEPPQKLRKYQYRRYRSDGRVRKACQVCKVVWFCQIRKGG